MQKRRQFIRLFTIILFINLCICAEISLVYAEEDKVPLLVTDARNAAIVYRESGDYLSACAEYEKIIQTFTGTAYALDSQVQIIILYLQNSLTEEARAALEVLWRDYSLQTEFVKRIHEVGWEFVKQKDYDTAIQVYTDLKNQFPDHERAPWFMRSIVQTYLEKGDIAKVAETVEDQKNSFKDHPQYVNQLHETAVRLRWKKMYAQAVDIYDYLLTEKPDCKEAAMLKCQQIKTLLEMDNLSSAKAEVGKLVTYMSDPNNYVQPVHELAWDFVMHKDYDTAIQIYTDLKNQFPAHERAPWFQRSIVQTYLEKGDMEKAAAAVEELKVNFKTHPDYVKQMCEMAVRFQWKKMYPQAVEIYDYLLATYPKLRTGNLHSMLENSNAFENGQSGCCRD